MAFSPLYVAHDSQDKVDAEIKNIATSAQDKNFIVFNSTPNLSDLIDGQIVLYSSGTLNQIMWRFNQEIFAIRGSCVTIRR